MIISIPSHTRCKEEDPEAQFNWSEAFEAGTKDWPQPSPSPSLSNTHRLQAAIKCLPISAETVRDIAVRAVRLREQQENRVVELASNEADLLGLDSPTVQTEFSFGGEESVWASMANETSDSSEPVEYVHSISKQSLF